MLQFLEMRAERARTLERARTGRVVGRTNTHDKVTYYKVTYYYYTSILSTHVRTGSADGQTDITIMTTTYLILHLVHYSGHDDRCNVRG